MNNISIINRKLILSVFAVAIITMSSLGIIINKFKNSTYFGNEKSFSAKESDSIQTSAWITYWDTENTIDELVKINRNIDSIQNFAAYFDNHDLLFIPDKNKEILNEVRQASKDDIKLYLSIVNDRINDDGTSTQKDSNLLVRLLATEESRNKHIDSILKLAIDGKYDGIEIDYEKIDKNTFDEFILFCSSLYKKLNEDGIELRIVLEPKEIIKQFDFPKGPEYVMMVYNLYDLNTEPGPKADQEFIAKVTQIMNSIPGKKWLAFATGGFDWVDGNKGNGLTEREASELLEKYKVIPERDEKSGCVHFKYVDEKKITHTVWYADEETFKLWIETSKKYGDYNISIWRLGGNREKFLRYISSI